MKNAILGVGDLIIDTDQIYSVSKIEDSHLFYQSTKVSENKSLCTCSIPLANLSLAHIRPLMTKTQAKTFLENLSTETPTDIPWSTSNRVNNSAFFKDILYYNDPIKTGKLLIFLQQNQQQSKLSTSDQSVFTQALNHLADEISLVLGISFDDAKEKILTVIKR